MDSTRCSSCGGTGLPSGFATELLAWDHRLLHSNELPEDLDVPPIQAAITSTETHLQLLDDEISRVRDKLSHLEDRYRELKDFHARQRAILSPLKRLPPEVLGEIFTGTLPPARATQSRKKITSSPWVLTHVSREWRTVAIGTSSLWSMAEINFIDDPTLYPVSMLETQLGRAQSLKIRFYGPGPGSKDDKDEDDAFVCSQIAALNCLARHAPCLEELDLYLHTDLIPALANLFHNIPRLRQLRLELNRDASAELCQSIHSFQIAPSLVDVTIYGGFNSLPALIPVHQLTRYSIGASWATHFGVLKLMHNLVEARIQVNEAEWWISFPPSGEILELFNLRHLYVSHFQILDFLKTPALETLSLWLWDESEIFDVHKKILNSSLVQSSAGIRDIHFGGEFAPIVIPNILRGIPSILNARIAILGDDNKWMPGVLSKLAVNGDNDVIASQLQSIHFAGMGVETFSYLLGPYLDMVKSRWDAPDCALLTSSFAEADVWLDRADPADLARVQSLRSDGLEILLQERDDLQDEWTLRPDFW